MPRKKREEPFEQGDIKRIYQLFFHPLVRYKPVFMPVKDWLDYIFHLKERDITQYEAVNKFRIPGLFYEAALRPVQGLGYRIVRKGTYLIVRKDMKESHWDVEFFGGVGDKEQVFKLSEEEWHEILPNIKEVPPRGMRGKVKTND